MSCELLAFLIGFAAGALSASIAIFAVLFCQFVSSGEDDE